MSTECYPIAMLPNTARLYRDYLAMGEGSGASVRGWYGAEPLSRSWMVCAPRVGHAMAAARTRDRA